MQSKIFFMILSLFENLQKFFKLDKQNKIMTDQETLRQSVLNQSDLYGSKRRFGLFSQPISTAVGDNGAYKKKMHPRDPGSNKPVTELRNFYTSPIRNGQRKSDYFGDINSLATSNVKDEFMEPGRRLIKEEKEKRDKGKKHQVSFFTGTGNKILAKPAYEYVEQKNPEMDPKRNREEDGRVKSLARNFYTNPQSKVQTSTFKPYKHMEDPYDRQREQERKNDRRNKSLEGQAAFRPNSFVPQLLNSEKKVREVDVEMKKVRINLKQKQPHETKFNIKNHDTPWRSSSPNKHGVYGYLAPFPEYKENPPKEVKRQPPNEQKKEPMKLMSPRNLDAPTRSISLHHTNILRGKR